MFSYSVDHNDIFDRMYCMLFSYTYFIKKNIFLQKIFKENITLLNSLNPDQARLLVGPDLGPNCLQLSSADNTSRQIVQTTSECT